MAAVPITGVKGVSPADIAKIEKAFREISALRNSIRILLQVPINRQTEFDALIWPVGPEGDEEPFEDNRYFVIPSEITPIEGTDQEDPDFKVAFQEKEIDDAFAWPRIVTATNLAENGTHLLEDLTPVRVHIRIDPTGDSPLPRYFFFAAPDELKTGIIVCNGPNGEDPPTKNLYWVQLAIAGVVDAGDPLMLVPGNAARLVVITGEQDPDTFDVGEEVTQLLASTDTATGKVLLQILDDADHDNDALYVRETSEFQFEDSDVNPVEGDTGSIDTPVLRKRIVLATNLSENLDESHYLNVGQYVEVRQVTGIDGTPRWEIES